MLFWVVLVLGIAFTVFFLVKRNANVTVEVTMLKSLCSVLFILSGLVGFCCNENGSLIYAVLIAGGALFGLLGDIWLDLKFAFREHDKPLTVAGFRSFLIGHLFFCGAMIPFMIFHGIII